MPKINPISGKKLSKILKNLGFYIIRIKGSHHLFYHADGRRTAVPIHNNEDIAIGTLKCILGDIEISAEEFNKMR